MLTFFCLKMLPSQKKLLVNTNFLKMMLHVNEGHEKLWGIHLSSNNLAHNGLQQSLPFKSQNGGV